MRRPEDLHNTLPALLGFQPGENPVLVGVHDSRVVAAAAINLADIATPGILAGLFRAIRRGVATGVVALVSTDAQVRTALLADPLAHTADWAGLDLVACLQVRGGKSGCCLTAAAKSTTCQPDAASGLLGSATFSALTILVSASLPGAVIQ